MTFADIKMKMTAMQFSLILSIPLSSFANTNPSKTHQERLKAKIYCHEECYQKELCACENKRALQRIYIL